MTLQVFNCEQGTPEWFACRMGIPTASEFSTVMAKGRNGDDSKTRRTYMLKLAGEILTGEPMESYSNPHMERGKAMEDEARLKYLFIKNAECERVGFIRNGDTGCSPDSLLGDNGMLEIKTTLPHLLIDRLLKDDFPPEHRAQCQGQLWVAQREWVDIAIYWPRLPLFVKRISRDEPYIRQLSEAVDQFNCELAGVVDHVRNYDSKAQAA